MTVAAMMLTGVVAFSQPAQTSAPPRVRVGAYLRSGVTVHLSPSQTMGGIGGGAGVRLFLSKQWIAQADFNALTLVGSVGEIRFGAGIQRPGMWAPAALATLSMLVGERVSFRTAEHPWLSVGPVVTGGIVLAPLRFVDGNRTVSVLELGMGAKPDLPGIGITYSVGLLEIGTVF